MRNTGAALLSLAVPFLAAGSGALAQQPPSDQRVQDTVLANGLEVIVVENHVVPLAMIVVAVRNGAFIQRAGEAGLAHVYEHLLFRGYEGDPSAFGSDVARMAGTFNGTTSQDVVTYYVVVPAKETSRAIDLLGKLIPRARFGAADLDGERPVILDEIHRDEADPEQRLGRRLSRRLWGDAWPRKDVGGDSASLQGIGLERLKEVFKRYYVPNNAALIVSGDVSPSAVVAAARDRLDKWKRAPDPFADAPRPPVPPLAGSSAELMAAQVHGVTVLVNLRGPGLRDDPGSTYAADVLFEILNEPSSYLQQQLVASGLFQSIEFTYATGADAGEIRLRGRTSEERSKDALSALTSLLDQTDLLLNRVTEDDLVIGKKRREMEAALLAERAGAMASSLAFWWAEGAVDHYRTYREHLNAETLGDLRAFAHRYLADQPRVIGVLGPPDVINWTAQWLRRPAPPPP